MIYPLTISIFLPLIFIPVIIFSKKQNGWWWVSLVALLQLCITCIFILPVYSQNIQNTFPILERLPWIYAHLGSFGILQTDYLVGVDGLNILMVLLSNIVFLVSSLASKSIDKYPKTYFSLVLLLNTATLGCFVALDFLLFFIFYEFMLLPMFLLIGIWGGDRREYAAIKFFLYTLFGSIFMILVMVGMFFSVIEPASTAVQVQLISDIQQFNVTILDKVQHLLSENLITADKMVHTFSFLPMADRSNIIPGSVFSSDSVLLGVSARYLAFGVLLLGFFIKLPVVPLHTWLPDAHVEAPTPISVILAGVLLKVGGYGIFRIAVGLFPEMLAQYQIFIAVMGVISVLYGAFVAIAQTDLKRMVAYSSVSHMGYVLVGLSSMQAAGWNGAIFQLFSHGMISSMLFLIVGVIYERTHSRNIEHFQGLWKLMPKYTFFVIIAFFAGLGLPVMSSFIAEVLVFMGSFATYDSLHPLPIGIPILAVFGVFFSAVYFIKNFQKVWMGKLYLLNENWRKQLSDLQFMEGLLFMFLTVMIILPGIFPSILLYWIDNSVSEFLSRIL
ncbi:MAG: oxidoreductase [Bacteroidia bacterium]|nr:MAG: oxidoreductase [Bacteroidia bacterium]